MEQDNGLILRALAFAAQKHRDQHRKDPEAREAYRLRIGGYHAIYSIDGERLIILVLDPAHVEVFINERPDY